MRIVAASNAPSMSATSRGVTVNAVSAWPLASSAANDESFGEWRMNQRVIPR
jgi:hypothetical protein